MKKLVLITWCMLLMPGFLFLQGCTEKTDTEPDNISRSSYLGRWSVTESWNKLAYEVNITADPGSSDGVFISNFANTGSSVTPAGASVSGSKITLDPDQIISGIQVNGSGTLSGSTINWKYTINDGADLITVTAVYSKL